MFTWGDNDSPRTPAAACGCKLPVFGVAVVERVGFGQGGHKERERSIGVH